MSRLTITLSEARYRALKEASARRDKVVEGTWPLPGESRSSPCSAVAARTSGRASVDMAGGL